MNRGNLSRRGFLGRTMAGLTAAGLPAWFAAETLAHAQQNQTQGSTSANQRLVMGAIGTGSNRFRNADLRPTRGERGVAIMQDAIRQSGVQMIAVCDVDRPNAEHAAGIVGRDCRIYDDFRELLANRDIQAVTIGTPDHWHGIIAIAAMKAGKDVYCEKPLTLTLEEGRALVRTAQQTGRVVQTGSQQRSDARFRLACELVRNGRIGRVQKITTLIGANPRGGPFATSSVPAGLDWNFWLGPTEMKEFVKERCHYEFRWWYEYSGGKMTDWGAHHNDIAQWGLGMDNSGPVTVRGRGETPASDGRSYNCHPTFEAVFTYANGTTLVCRDGPPQNWPVRNPQGRPEGNGILFEGEGGKWIFVNRGFISASDGNAQTSNLIREPLPSNATRLQVSTNHMGNFVECVRTRQQPICNPTVGHRSVSVCHLGNIAIRTGLDLRWDPQAERFVGANASQANSHLSRPMRDPWAAYYRELTGTPGVLAAGFEQSAPAVENGNSEPPPRLFRRIFRRFR